MKPWRLFFLLFVVGCSSVPGTGRSRLTPFMSVDQQMQLGAEAYAETLGDANIITSGPEYEMVQRVGARISKSPVLHQLFPEQAEKFAWEFKLIDEPETLNAWALPGGKCAVYTGILKVTQDEDGLAAVVGHEIAHAVAEHGAERMTTQGIASVGLAAAQIGLSGQEEGDQQLLMAALGAGAQFGLLLPFSRTHESEADELGVYFAASAGYQPDAAIGLWQRMGQLSQGAPPEFMSTHPSSDTRIQRLREVMPKAMGYYREAQRAEP